MGGKGGAVASEKEEAILEEIKTLIEAGIKAKGSEDVVFLQTVDGKVKVKVQ